MATFDWSPYAVGGALRPDSFSGLNPVFNQSLSRLISSAPPEISPHLRVTSGFRSPERQAQLWKEALQKYGSESVARKWVAPPGRSQHNHGAAADLKFLNDSAREWAHANAAQYGLSFPLSNEPWHIELASARGGGTPAPTENIARRVAAASDGGGISGLARPEPSVNPEQLLAGLSGLPLEVEPTRRTAQDYGLSVPENPRNAWEGLQSASGNIASALLNFYGRGA